MFFAIKAPSKQQTKGGLMAKTNEKQKNVEVEKEIAFDCLAVTKVDVWPFKEGADMGHMKGYAQVVLNEQMVLRGLRVMDGEYGLFVSYPNDPFFKGEDYRNIYNPITRKLREHIENCVLEKYQAAVAA
jgi:stage V sporulation protein G